MGPLIAVLVVVAVVVVAILGYGVGGYAFAQGRLSKADSALNAAADHQNTLNAAVDSLGGKMSSLTTANASSADFQQASTLMDQIISQSKDAQPLIASDDQALASADSGLKENTWLTVLSRSKLDQKSTRIGYARHALADAKTITDDYIKFGAFFKSFIAVVLDVEDLSTKAGARDFTGAATANQSLKTDVAAAIQQDKAPGLPPEMDAFLRDVQTFANDFGTALNAIANHDATAAQTAAKALEADSTKIQGYDFTKMGNDIDSYYKPLIDDYNATVDKLNASR